MNYQVAATRSQDNHWIGWAKTQPNGSISIVLNPFVILRGTDQITLHLPPKINDTVEPLKSTGSAVERTVLPKTKSNAKHERRLLDEPPFVDRPPL